MHLLTLIASQSYAGLLNYVSAAVESPTTYQTSLLVAKELGDQSLVEMTFGTCPRRRLNNTIGPIANTK